MGFCRCLGWHISSQARCLWLEILFWNNINAFWTWPEVSFHLADTGLNTWECFSLFHYHCKLSFRVAFPLWQCLQVFCTDLYIVHTPELDQGLFKIQPQRLPFIVNQQVEFLCSFVPHYHLFPGKLLSTRRSLGSAESCLVGLAVRPLKSFKQHHYFAFFLRQTATSSSISWKFPTCLYLVSVLVNVQENLIKTHSVQVCFC